MELARDLGQSTRELHADNSMGKIELNSIKSGDNF
jgi:hypothetical protein